MKEFRLRVRSAEQIVQVVDNGAKVLKGNEMKSLAIMETRVVASTNQKDGLSIVVDK